MTLPDLSSYQGPIALDTETYDPKLTSLGPGFLKGWGSFMIGFSYAMAGGKYGYIPTRHSHGNYEGDWKEWLRDLCADKDRTLVFANAKYDIEVLWSENIHISAKIVDIQTLDAIINENNENFSLAGIAARRGLPSKGTLTIENALIDRGFSIRNKPDWTKLKDLPLEIVRDYAELDASLTLAIYHQQLKEIEKDNLERVAELESALIPVFWQMRLQGVRVNLGAAENLNFELQEANMNLLNDIVVTTGKVEPFASASLAKWVRNLGFDPPKTKKDNDSISNEWLEAQGHEYLTKMAEYRKAEKMRRDYVDALVLENSNDGRVHPQWFSTRGGGHQSGGDNFQGTRSGRPSCTNPNLTQIPARHPVFGPAIRGLFLPERQAQWGKFDYSAQEPRITLHYAYILGMPGARDIYNLYKGNPRIDFHQATADMIERVTNIRVTRQQAKTINLGLAYGMGKAKLARSLGLDKAAAEAFLEAYHQSLRFMKNLLKYCDERAQRQGYVKTVLGRRRHFDEWEKADYKAKWEAPIKDEAEARALWGQIKRAKTYKSLNSVIQGSAAEQTKTAMNEIFIGGMVPLAQVYDELDYNIYSQEQADYVKRVMEGVNFFEVPHVVDVMLSESWPAK
jgi:DNA polymerase-1